MAELLITTASHFFKLSKITPRARPAIVSFCRQLVQYGWVKNGSRYTREALRVFATSTFDRSIYHLHINQLEQFKEHLKTHSLVGDLVAYEHMPAPEGVDVKLDIKSHWSDRDYQIPAIGYIVEDNGNSSKFLPLQTGRGKGYISMRALSIIGKRTVIVVQPKYLDKWVKELGEKFIIENENDLVVIRGSSQLMSLLLKGSENDLDAKIILISSKTIANWIRLYEKFMYQTLGMGYACIPEDLCATIGAGNLLIDEVHQEFYSNFKLLLNTNVKTSICLSATLLSDDAFINKMYGVVFPVLTQYKGDAYVKYIEATAVFYRFKEPGKIRYKDFVSKTYSHHLFEQSILRNKQIKENYFNLIKTLVDGSYIKNYKPGQKCLILCISIDMCTFLCSYLKTKYPKLDIRRYVAEDPFSDLMEADISISTVQNAGTAVDIPMLSTCILSIAMSTIQGNVQGFGRLRPLADGSTPKFLYMNCEDIPKHIDYHEKKRELLSTRALYYNNVYIGDPI